METQQNNYQVSFLRLYFNFCRFSREYCCNFRSNFNALQTLILQFGDLNGGIFSVDKYTYQLSCTGFYGRFLSCRLKLSLVWKVGIVVQIVLPMSNSSTAEYPHVCGGNCMLTLPFSFLRSDLVFFSACSTSLFD